MSGASPNQVVKEGKAAKEAEDKAAEHLEKALKELSEENQQGQGQQQEQQNQEQQGQEQNQGGEQQQQQEQRQAAAPDTTARGILDKEQRDKKQRQIFQRAGYQKVDKDW